MDYILHNGIIHTMTGRTVSAVCVKNERFVMVGDDEVLKLKTAQTKVIDLKGKTVLPGFTDTHTHLVLTGMSMCMLDLRDVNSLEEIIERGKKYISENPPKKGEWVMGYGFDHNKFNPPVFPDALVADAISTEFPVVLDRICGHVGAANHLALKEANFDENTVISGGVLDKDENGKLTGVLRESALDKIKLISPRMTQSQAEKYIDTASKEYASAGIVSVHSDDICPQGTTWEILENTVKNFEETGNNRIRIWEEWEVPRPKELNEFLKRGIKSGYGEKWLHFANIKLLSDGSLGTRTAFLKDDYSDDVGNRGICVYTQDELDEMVKICHDNDIQTAVHSIGDGASQMFVNSVEKAMIDNPKPIIHRNVHCQIGDKDLYKKMASLGVGADIQPCFIYWDQALVSSRLGEREKESYSWKSLLNYGILLGGGADSPVEPHEPLWGIHCAVNRVVANGTVWKKEEALTVKEAVELYTVNAAKLVGDLKNSGTIEAGKYADFVVLEEDIFTINPLKIKDVKVMMTMCCGKITFENM